MSKIEPGLLHAVQAQRDAMAKSRQAKRRACRSSDKAEPGNTAAALPVTITMRGENGGLQRHAAKWLPSDHPDMHVIDRMGISGELDSRLYANAQALLNLWGKTGIGCAQVSSYEPRIASTTGDEGRDDEATWHDAMRRLQPHYQYLLGGLVRGAHPGAYLPNVRTALDGLDYLTAAHDGEMWRGE